MEHPHPMEHPQLETPMSIESLTPQELEALHLDYEQTTAQIRMLTDIRFKLLAFVPTLTGVAVSLLTGGKVGTGTVLAVGILGFVVTFGIIIYELRNSLFYDLSFLRASHLEQKLHFPNFTHINEAAAGSGGVFTERPGSGEQPSQKFLGIISIRVSGQRRWYRSRMRWSSFSYACAGQ